MKKTAIILASVVLGLGSLGALGAAAAEVDDDPVIVEPTEEPTTEPTEGTGEEEPVEGEDEGTEDEGDGEESANGLSCELVPIETEGEAPEEGIEEGTEEGTEEEPIEEEPTEPLTIEEALEGNEIVCTGVGNDRAASVALLPRFLAHSDLWTGAEKGQAISEWAKGQHNKKGADDGEEAPEETPEESPEDDEALTTSNAGNGNQGGNGNGRGPKH